MVASDISWPLHLVGQEDLQEGGSHQQRQREHSCQDSAGSEVPLLPGRLRRFSVFVITVNVCLHSSSAAVTAILWGLQMCGHSCSSNLSKALDSLQQWPQRECQREQCCHLQEESGLLQCWQLCC